jgi:hypothetical protein
MKSLKNSREYVFFQIERETTLLLVNNLHEKINVSHFFSKKGSHFCLS